VREAFIGFLVVLAGIVLSIAGLLLVRHLFPSVAISDSNEVGDSFITVLGTAYGVLVAFVVSTVWSRFTDAEREADEEANQIFTLMYILGLIKTATGHQVLLRLVDYTHSLLNDEWGELQKGRGSDKTLMALRTLWASFDDLVQEEGLRDLVVTQAMHRLEGLTDCRRLRLFNCDDTIPTVLWVLLVVEGVITVAFTYLLVAPSLLIQGLMTAALAGTVSLSLYLIAALNHPFAGVPRVTEENLRSFMHRWEQMIPSYGTAGD
jgi:Protein of unknown function (DUF4239)